MLMSRRTRSGRRRGWPQVRSLRSTQSSTMYSPSIQLKKGAQDSDHSGVIVDDQDACG